MFEITCVDLGIQDCDFHVEGETPADVIEQVREHLREHKDMNLPETDDILDGDYQLDDLDEGVELIVTRLRQKLHVTPAEAPTPVRVVPPVVPPHGTTPGSPPHNL